MDILAWQGTPGSVVRHCQTVAAVAMRLAGEWNETGGSLELPLVQAGALLHDLAKGRADHANGGKSLLRELDCPEVAEIVGNHMRLPAGEPEQLDESALVYYADKRVKNTGTVTLEEWFALSREGLRDDQKALGGVEERLQAACRIESLLQSRGVKLP